MKNAEISKIYKTQSTSDGAGVKLQRVFGFNSENEFDPFLLLDHFKSDNPSDYMAGFPFHPHRGIETLTYLKKGSIEHQDKLGNKELLLSGGIQWMTTGKGIYHQEMPRDEGGINGFQLWVNLPSTKKMINPSYITKDTIPVNNIDGVKTSVISGVYRNLKGPATDISSQNIHFFDVDIDKDRVWSLGVEKNLSLFIYAYNGCIKVGRRELQKGEVAKLICGEELIIKGLESSNSFLFLAGVPINEEISWWGPIVMNTREEIMQAKEELFNGTFPLD